MNYQESLAYLDSLGKFGIRLGMERIEALLEELGRPERGLRLVHVAGTNGKGSVASIIASILSAAGLKTGKFTSPHLVRYNERIALDGRDVSDEELAQVLTRVREAAAALLAAGRGEQPTQFEVLTAAAFLYFAQQGVDYGVIEVGLGGLWDSTNVITPLVSVITNIQHDHMDRCGSSLAAIAGQKAGIIKEGVPLVTAAEGEEALEVILAAAASRHAPCYLYGRDFWGEEEASSMAGQRFTLHVGPAWAASYRLTLPGEHQVVNASVALMAARLLAAQDRRITEDALQAGTAAARWPGRLELVARHPDVILDGAHNLEGAQALRRALDKYYPAAQRSFVLGMMGDKDMAGVLGALLRPADRVYTVRADQGSRAAEAQVLAELAGAGAVAVDSLEQAYAQALAACGPEGVVCVCGSLYLVGNFKSRGWLQ